ncbi:MAG: hypothetical protein J6I83_02145 [Firmicutes bacterium]|nr:hypothetical protein [Bacillota bacterium]
MAGRNSMMIDEKITQAQEQVIKTKEKYEEAVARLEELLAKKRAMQNEELVRLFANSNRTYEEVVSFLKEGMSEEQLALGTKKKPGRKAKTSI